MEANDLDRVEVVATNEEDVGRLLNDEFLGPSAAELDRLATAESLKNNSGETKEQPDSIGHLLNSGSSGE
jgi:hypothetical protein